MSLAKNTSAPHLHSPCPPCFLQSLSVLCSICPPRSDRLEAISPDKKGPWRWRQLTRGPGQTGHVQPSTVISEQQCVALVESYSGCLMHEYPCSRLSCLLPGRDTKHSLYQGRRQLANWVEVFHMSARDKRKVGVSEVKYGRGSLVLPHRCCLKDRARGPKFGSTVATFRYFSPQLLSIAYMDLKGKCEILLPTSRCHQITLEPSERRGIRSARALVLHSPSNRGTFYLTKHLKS